MFELGSNICCVRCCVQVRWIPHPGRDDRSPHTFASAPEHWEVVISKLVWRGLLLA